MTKLRRERELASVVDLVYGLPLPLSSSITTTSTSECDHLPLVKYTERENKRRGS